MEQNYIEHQVKNQIQLTIREANSEVKYSTFRFRSKPKLSNIFMTQNKGKGPPGRTSSPGLAYCPTRDNQPLTLKITNNYLIKIKFQIFTNIKFLQS